MQFVDTHCHIHDADVALTGEDPVQAIWLRAGKKDPDEIITAAAEQAVNRLICIGTTLKDSETAINFVKNRPHCWASIGIHPHEAKDYANQPELLKEFADLATKPKVVAVGECGLDYFYNHSPKEQQIQLLKFQIELALEHDLPLIFHVREAFDDFWPIVDTYPKIRGVVHSFSADPAELEKILQHKLYVGLNGIMTFTKKPEQLVAAKAVPLDKMLLETDAPFLTPTPYRGTICEPKHVRTTAEFLSKLRGESLEELATATTHNAITLFGLE
jgi:TatD DNase family protein